MSESGSEPGSGIASSRQAAALVSDLRCVALDLDDTLYLERDYVRSGFAAVGRWALGRFGLGGIGEVAWNLFEAGHRGTTLNAALEAAGVAVTAEAITEAVTVYREHVPDIGLAPDAARALARLSGRVPMAVVTDGPLASQQAKAEALGAFEWADLVVLTADLGEGFAKPHRRAFELVERRTGAEGAECVYVADNPFKDFIAPRALGWRTIRVRRALSLHVDIASGDDVDVEVPDLSFFDLSCASPT